MKIAIKTVMLGIAACAFATPSFAYTLNGNVPPGRPTEIHLQRPPNTGGGYLKLTLKVPQAESAGTTYSVGFCLGPRQASCTQPVVIPGGQEIVVFYNAANWTYPVWLGQGTRAAVPYVLDVDYLEH